VPKSCMTVADLLVTVRRWRSAAVAVVPNATWSPHRLREVDVEPYALRCAEAARAAVECAAPPGADGLFSVCLVSKRPHIAGHEALTFVAARLLAFGCQRLGVHAVPPSRQVPSALYPDAERYFAGIHDGDANWRRIDTAFDRPSFARIFGRRYDRSLVCPAGALQDGGLSMADITRIWEEGRSPLPFPLMVDRYGAEPAAMLRPDGGDFDWFRSALPVGIHRIASGLVAFALRHPAVRGGYPTIVLNGHYPGLVELFAAGCFVLDAGFPAAGPPISEVRTWVVGDDNRPQLCRPGTVRRDAADGVLPLDSAAPVDSRRNVLHCSDGLVSGLIELRRILPGRTERDALPAALDDRGLTTKEIDQIVLRDPMVRIAGTERRLTAVTRGMGTAECVSTIIRLVPPVFGPSNGHSSGLGIDIVERSFAGWTRRGVDSFNLANEPPARPANGATACLAELPASTEAVGAGLLAEGRVALVVPAGGTGGRFGGYHLPEDDPRRHKALREVLQLRGGPLSPLDIRLANARHWRQATGGRLPIAIMASPTSWAALAGWVARRRETGATDIDLFRQWGGYRFDAAASSPQGRWIDAILRDDDGVPSLKPPGNLGTFTCLALAGIMQRWLAGGVRYVVFANADDVGFRLDPRVLGMLHGVAADAIVLGVPPRYRARSRRDGREISVIADAGGHYLTTDGLAGHGVCRVADEVLVTGSGEQLALTELRADRGGHLCDVEVDGHWRVGVAEHRPPAGDALLNANQFYWRLDSLARALGVEDGSDPLASVRRVVAEQPMHAERKLVRVGGRQADAVQLVQYAHTLLRGCTAVPLVSGSALGGSRRGAFLPIKDESDAVLAQVLLETLDRCGDELAFPPDG